MWYIFFICHDLTVRTLWEMQIWIKHTQTPGKKWFKHSRGRCSSSCVCHKGEKGGMRRIWREGKNRLRRRGGEGQDTGMKKRDEQHDAEGGKPENRTNMAVSSDGRRDEGQKIQTEECSWSKGGWDRDMMMERLLMTGRGWGHVGGQSAYWDEEWSVWKCQVEEERKKKAAHVLQIYLVCCHLLPKVHKQRSDEQLEGKMLDYSLNGCCT